MQKPKRNDCLEKSTEINLLNQARELAVKLDVEYRYQWTVDYWTKDELLGLIRGFEKRLGMNEERCRYG